MHPARHIGHSIAEFRIHFNILSFALLPIEDSSAAYLRTIHFLKSHSLCYNLVSVTITDLAMTPLVLHRHYRELPAGDKFRNTALSCCNRMQLHRICDAEQSQSPGSHMQPAKSDNPERAAFAYRRVVNPFMQQSPFGCKKIFLPLTFEMNESPLPFTKHKMLYARQRDHFIIGIIA